MNILFITSTRIGDAVITTGLLDYCLNTYLNADITVACGPLVAPLFEDMTRLKNVHVLIRQGRFGHWWKLWHQMVATRWDIVIDIRGSALAYVLKAKQRYVWSARAFKTGHRVEQLSQLMNLPCVHAPTLTISTERSQRIAALLPHDRKIIAMAPAANWIGKEWPLTSFIELEKILTAEHSHYDNATILVLAAPDEYHRLQPLFDAIPPERLLIWQDHPHLLDAAAALAQVDLFVGNDSGLMHMAAALNVPTLGLFGPSPHQHYAPYGLKADFVRTPEGYDELMRRRVLQPDTSLMTSLTVDKVMQAIGALQAKHATA